MKKFVIIDEYDEELFEAEDAAAAEAYGNLTTSRANTWFGDIYEPFVYEANIYEIVMNSDDENEEEWSHVDGGIHIVILKNIPANVSEEAA